MLQRNLLSSESLITFAKGKWSKVRNFWSTSSTKERVLAAIAGIAVLCFFVFFAFLITGKAGLLIVRSASMEPYMPPGSLVVFMESDISQVDTGDIIVFRDGAASSTLVTHRALEKTKENGRVQFKTKGDNNSRSDSAVVDSSVLMGKVSWVVPLAGWLMAFTKTPAGLLVLDLLLVFLIVMIALDKLKASMRASLDAYQLTGNDEENAKELVHPAKLAPNEAHRVSLKK